MLVFDRALIPGMDVAFSEGMTYFILSRALGSVHGASWKYPLPYSSMCYPMTPLQSAVNVALRAWSKGAFLPLLMRLSAKRRAKNKALGADNPFKAAPVIVGNAPLLELNQPVPANIKLVGPILSLKAAPEDEELNFWLGGRETVIYAAFGTLAVFTEEQLKILCSGLLSTGYRILWALPGPNFDLIKDMILPRLSETKSEPTARGALCSSTAGAPTPLRVRIRHPRKSERRHGSARCRKAHGGDFALWGPILFRCASEGTRGRRENRQDAHDGGRHSIYCAAGRRDPLLCACSAGGASCASSARWIKRGHETH